MPLRDGWIKCADRLPLKAGQYIAAYEDRHVCEDEFYGPEHGNQWWCESHAYHGKVTHWQPLPEPPNAPT